MMDPSYYDDQHNNARQYSPQREAYDDGDYHPESNPKPSQYYGEGGTQNEPRHGSPRDNGEYYSESNPNPSQYYGEGGTQHEPRRGSPHGNGEHYSESSPIPSQYYTEGGTVAESRRDGPREDEEYYSQSNPNSSDYYTEGGTLDESRLDSSRFDRLRMQEDDMEFEYDEDNDPHLPPIDDRRIENTEPGEFHGDTHDVKITITSKVYVYAACAAINSWNLGYNIGINTVAATKIQNSMDLSGVQVQLLMGSLNLFSIMGTLCSHFVSDNMGRRRTFQFASGIFILGALIVCGAGGFYTLIFGRLFVGLGIGFGIGIDPMYIAEIAPAARRGQLVSWCDVAMNIGIVNGFLSNIIFNRMEDDLSWRYMIGMGTILPAILIVLACFVMPESPRWLVSKGRDDEAAIVLETIYPQDYSVDLIVRDIGDTLDREYEAEHAYGWDVILFPTPAFRRMLLVGFGCAIAQQAVGIDAIQYFLIFVIDEAGIKSQGGQYAVLILLGLFRLAFVFIAGCLFDSKGRRPLIFTSLAGMALALIVNSMTWMARFPNVGVSIFTICLYFMSYSIGMGPGSWLIPSEVFATSIRAKAISVAAFLNRVVATIVTSTFLQIAGGITWAGFFFIQAFICLAVAIFFFVYLPELKGRPLEDMSLYFAEITGDRAVLEIDEVLKIRERDQANQEMRSLEIDSRTIDGSARIEASGTMA